MFNRLGRCLVAWLAASSLLVASTAAIVHTHEHSPGHVHEKCSESTKPVKHQHAGCKHQHAGCKHHHHHADPVSQPETPHQHPTPQSHDDCALCHFLLEHSLPPSHVELPSLDVVLEFRPTTPQVCAVVADFDLPPARGPPCAA